MLAMPHKIYIKRLNAATIPNGSSLCRSWQMIIMKNSILIHLIIQSCGQKINFLGCQWDVWSLIETQLIFMPRLSKLLLVQVCLWMAWISLMIRCSKGVRSLIPIHSGTVLAQTIYNYPLTHQKDLSAPISVVAKWISAIRPNLETIHILTMNHQCLAAIKKQIKG